MPQSLPGLSEPPQKQRRWRLWPQKKASPTFWKPNTRPNNFEGIGTVGLEWLRKAKEATGMKIGISHQPSFLYLHHLRLIYSFNSDKRLSLLKLHSGY